MLARIDVRVGGASFPRKRESKNRPSQVSEEWSIVPRALRGAIGGLLTRKTGGIAGRGAIHRPPTLAIPAETAILTILAS